MNYRLYIIKRNIEDILIFPFVVLGRLLSRSLIKHDRYDIIFIFPFYHTGGAEKVHLEIAKAFSKKKCLILFSRKSVDNCFKQAFKEIGHDIVDISSYTDNKFTYWNNLIWRGVISSLVHSQHEKTIVFNGQSNFGYKLSRWIHPAFRQVELIHSFNSFSWIRIPFICNYTKTVMISNKAIDQHRMQYKKIHIPPAYSDRIHYINNGIEIDHYFMATKPFDKELKVLYVGRATPEKRPTLFCKIAQEAHQRLLPIHFEMVGDIAPYVNEALQKNIRFYGAVHDSKEMNGLYDQADILMVTSSEEGFPLVIMEAMARGCVIISTPVGDIPYHIKTGKNGFLFSNATNEFQLLEESMLMLDQLNTNRDTLKQISKNNIEYAKKVFELGKFADSYARLIESIKA